MDMNSETRRSAAETARRFPRRALKRALTVGVLAALCGCSSPGRKDYTDEQFKARAAADSAYMGQTVQSVSSSLVARLEREQAAGGPNSEAVVHFLAMSGGGDYGAFGAGFLVGWGQASDPAWRRPDFDVVTGVSTGALLAPFAFVGTDEACRKVEGFYRDPKPDWVESRGLLFFAPWNPSFMVIPKLAEALELAVDKPMVDQMAEASRNGKQLMISATDLDLGRQHLWNLGSEAEAASASGNLERVHKILLASAAIPAAFPAVELDGSLYADGGVTANVFVRLEPRSPLGVIQTWKRVHPDKPLPKVRYWIIINNQFNQTPATVQEKWPSVLGPSLATAIRSATLAEVRWLAAQADFVNVALNMDVEVRVVAIPDEWRALVKGDFQKANMESLADIGRNMGADPASWQLWASPKFSRDLTAPIAPASGPRAAP